MELNLGLTRVPELIGNALELGLGGADPVLRGILPFGPIEHAKNYFTRALTAPRIDANVSDSE